MTIQEINRAYNRITGSLDNKELKNAFVFLRGMIVAINEYSFLDRLKELEDTYKYMLQYRLNGAKDPMQEQIYNTLLSSTYELTDSVKHKALSVVSPLIYYSKRRSLSANLNISYDELLEILNLTYLESEEKTFETTLITLFNKIWLSDHLTVEEVLSIKKIIHSKLPDLVICQLVSALLLALQASFDREKFFLLFDAIDKDSDEIRVRALIGILLTLYIYRKRTGSYPQIPDRLATLSEKYPSLTQDIRSITLRFILAHETEKITRKLQEEIIPEMMKLNSKLHKKFDPNASNEQLSEEMNPEWQDIFSDSSLDKKMQEFGELQQEGADVMHSTFVHLKNFPFFHELSNWFLPFTTQHSSFGSVAEKTEAETQMLETLSLSAFMCNSDKYSLYFSMRQMPEEQRKMVMGQFGGQASEMIQQSKEELITKRGNFEVIAGQYIQDLYRFYKLYPAHLDFDDIFTLPLDFQNLTILQPYISDEESLTIIAEYYLRKQYYQEALSLFQQLVSNNLDSSILFQKIGYCKQMLGDIDGALESYLQADLIYSESKWVIKRIAGCYRSLKNPEEALKYFSRYEVLAPEDLSVQLNIGHCYLELKNYNEALKYYFKVDYLEGESMKAWRPIAWCSFLIGKYDQARHYYKKIMEKSPNTQDYLNAGHTEWVLQNIKGAVNFYKLGVKSEEDDLNKFLEQFQADVSDLLTAGIEEEEVPLMIDQIRYSLEDN